MTNGDRLKAFSDEEIYVIKRAFLDSGFDTNFSEIYEKRHKEVHKKLLLEFVSEDTTRVGKGVQG